MGRRIGVQKRGRAANRFTAPSHRFKTEAHYRQGEAEGVVEGFTKDPSKTTLVVNIRWADGRTGMYLAAEGAATKSKVVQSAKAKLNIGNVLPLSSIPEGVPIFNIEGKPGDGGKSVRASGTTSFIVSKKNGDAFVRLPSKKVKKFNEKCLATIGIAACGGRPEKPIMKAGNQYHMSKARGHHFPIVRGVAMNPIAHPHGGSQHHAGKPTTVKRGASPGRKVGHIAARRTGRRKK